MDGKSLNVKKERIDKLKALMPEVFGEEDNIDFDKLKLTLGENLNSQNERYVLNWAGKSDSFKVLQTPTTATLAPDKEESINFDTPENIFIEGENLEVLKVLQKSYFGKIKMIYIDPPYNTGNDSFIYPDKFSESKEEYLKRIGEKDEEGFLLKEGLFRKNSKENGQYHSNWLSMMYPRLFLARNLLREDGVIFVSIDDNEVHNLRMIMNEIFGEENTIATIIWQKKYTRSNDARWFSDTHDYILVYAKNSNIAKINLLDRTEKQLEGYSNPDSDKRGDWKATPLHAKSGSVSTFKFTFKNGITWSPPKGTYSRFSFETLRKMDYDNELWFGRDGKTVPSKKSFLSQVKEGVTPITIWPYQEVGHNHEANSELKELEMGGIFDNPKPTRLIKRTLQLVTQNNQSDIILDFFAGSGTTAQAVFELNKEDGGNRKFILVQLPEKISEDSEAYRGGFKTIADICKDRIGRVIKKMSEPLIDTNKKKSQKESFNFENNTVKSVKSNESLIDFGLKVFKLKNSNFKLWRGDVIETGEGLEKQLDAFEDPVKKNTHEINVVYELLLKLGYDLNVDIKYEEICIDAIGEFKNGIYRDDVSGNFQWWSIDSGKLIIVTDSEGAASNLLNHLKDEKTIPEKVICLDKIFDGCDEEKTNLVLQMKDAGVEFKTV